MRTRRKAIVLGVSAAAHLALVAVWMSARPDPAEPPALQVQLVRLPPNSPPPPPKSRERPPTPSIAAPRPLEIHRPPPQAPPPAPTAPTPVEISPEWRVKPGGGDLDAAPFVLGRDGLRHARAPRATCKTHGWDRPLDCPPDNAEIAASKSDPARDARTGAFAAEGERKLTLKSYRESSSTSDYPGIRCSIFHKC